MKSKSQLMFVYLLAFYSVISVHAAEERTAWQKWKKPIIATTMAIGVISIWLLSDYYLNSYFDNQLEKTTIGLANGNKTSAFFNGDGTLRKHPYISDLEFKDFQLYENARFWDMYDFKSRLSRNQIGIKLCYLISLITFSWLTTEPSKEKALETTQINIK